MLTPQTPLYRAVPPWPEHQADKPPKGKLPYYAFHLRPEDNSFLSMDNGHLATPTQCLNFYNQDPNAPQANQVAKLTIQQTESLTIPVLTNSLLERPSHILLDLSSVSQMKASRALRHYAEQNGILTPTHQDPRTTAKQPH